MDALTARQAEILRFIAVGASAGMAPTYREIGNAFGISSTHGVSDHVAALVRKGYLERIHMTARGMLLTSKARTYLRHAQPAVANG